MKALYLDVFSGMSGDMFLGAMLDLGVELTYLESELRKLDLGGYHLHSVRRQNSHIAGVKFDVHLEGDDHHDGGEHDHAHESAAGHEHVHHHDHDHDHKHDHEQGGQHHAPHGDHDPHSHGHSHSHEHEHEHEETRDFASIKRLIQSSALSVWVKQKAHAVFQRVAEAEGKVHGLPVDQVHFHEVGAIDSIIDIVGACIALERLGKPRVFAAAIVDGTGWVDCAHGRFPVPTMATLEILGARGIPLTQCDEPHELVTPTGAALLAEFAETFGPMQGLVAHKIGYGLGTRINKRRPNVLRAVLGETASVPGGDGSPTNDWETDTVTIVQTNLDDCPGEILGQFVERALAAGALDVFYTPVQMKKNRPGVLLTILCEVPQADAFSEMILRHTSAFGVRRSTAERRKLRRESVKVQTPQGEVELKLGKLNGHVLRATPEFESCQKLAAEAQMPLQRIYEAAADVSRQFTKAELQP